MLIILEVEECSPEISLPWLLEKSIFSLADLRPVFKSSLDVRQARLRPLGVWRKESSAKLVKIWLLWRKTMKRLAWIALRAKVKAERSTKPTPEHHLMHF